ncbi:MAG: hypothetical protein FJZ90_18570, partial [Chloroflexi bacterium]|nr:hypothetical protein [Chloroflexota bacterium]
MRLAYRIQLPQLETDEQFTRLLGFLDRHRAAVDELALFTDYCHHGYTPPAVFAARAAIISQRIEV